MSRKLGRALVFGMPGFLTFLAAVGTAAMTGLAAALLSMASTAYDVPSVGHAIGSVAQAAAHALPSVAAAVQWMVETYPSTVGRLVQ